MKFFETLIVKTMDCNSIYYVQEEDESQFDQSLSR